MQRTGPIVVTGILLTATILIAVSVASTYLKAPDDLQITNIALTNSNATLTIRNGGLAGSVINTVYINDIDATASATPALPLDIASGGSATLTISCAFTSGIKYMLKLVTSKGNQFPVVMYAP